MALLSGGSTDTGDLLVETFGRSLHASCLMFLDCHDAMLMKLLPLCKRENKCCKRSQFMYIADMKSKQETEVIAVRAPKSFVEKLDDLAKKDMRTRSSMILHLLAKAIGWREK